MLLNQLKRSLSARLRKQRSLSLLVSFISHCKLLAEGLCQAMTLFLGPFLNKCLVFVVKFLQICLVSLEMLKLQIWKLSHPCCRHLWAESAGAAAGVCTAGCWRLSSCGLCAHKWFFMMEVKLEGGGLQHCAHGYQQLANCGSWQSLQNTSTK